MKLLLFLKFPEIRDKKWQDTSSDRWEGWFNLLRCGICLRNGAYPLAGCPYWSLMGIRWCIDWDSGRGQVLFKSQYVFLWIFFIFGLLCFYCFILSSQPAFSLREISYSNFIKYQPIYICLLNTDYPSLGCNSLPLVYSASAQSPSIPPPYPATAFLGKCSSDNVTVLSETFPLHPLLCSLAT